MDGRCKAVATPGVKPLIEQFEKSQGFRQQFGNEQPAKKELIDIMVAEGTEADWASTEFQRRFGLPEELMVDIDPDCSLVRV